VGGTYPQRTPTRVGRGRRRHYPRSIGVGQVTQALTAAYAPGHQACVTVDKRPRRLALLPANSAGQVGPGRLPVQLLVEVQQLAAVRMRVRARPLRHVGEAEPHQATHQCSGQMPEVPLSTGGGIPHPRHLQHPLGSKDGRRRGRLPPAERSANLGHCARHPGREPEGHLHCRPPSAVLPMRLLGYFLAIRRRHFVATQLIRGLQLGMAGRRSGDTINFWGQAWYTTKTMRMMWMRPSPMRSAH